MGIYAPHCKLVTGVPCQLLCLLQGEIFAAEGYAKTTGDVGVCIATSGPGATNLVTGLADALLDSVPMVAITGQVPRKMIGTDAFQETPIVEVTRQITKHNYLVMHIEDLPRCAPHLCTHFQPFLLVSQRGFPSHKYSTVFMSQDVFHS